MRKANISYNLDSLVRGTGSFAVFKNMLNDKSKELRESLIDELERIYDRLDVVISNAAQNKVQDAFFYLKYNDYDVERKEYRVIMDDIVGDAGGNDWKFVYLSVDSNGKLGIGRTDYFNSVPLISDEDLQKMPEWARKMATKVKWKN